jgi:predicted transcriptional regulator
MADPSKLSRRERQIMDRLYARRKATVNEVRGDLPDPPTDKAVRRMLEILEEKGHVKRRKDGREFVYRPTQSKKLAGERALRHVLETFFGGALDQAVAVHLGSKKSDLTDEELARLSQLIEEARQQGR